MATHNFHPWTCPHFIGFLINVKDSLSCTNFLDFAEILSPDKKRAASYVLAEKKSPHVHVAEDKQLNEYKDQLYLMTVLSGNPLGEGTMQVIKSEK